MNLSPKSSEGVRLAAAGLLAAALGACVFVVQSSCSTATAPQRANAAKAETDLCRLRLLAAAVEEVTPELRPDAGSIRAELEAAEDKFCASVLNGEGGTR